MAKKWFTAVVAFMMIFSGLFATASAETDTQSKMYETFKERISNEHYDFKKGSLKLTDVKTFNLNEPITIKKGDKSVKVTTVKAAVAKYQTVRDVIYVKDFKKPVFYAPKQDMVLKDNKVKKVGAIKSYIKQHPAHASMQLGAIAAVLLVLLIVVPGIFLFIWHKFKHSTMEYQMNHKLTDSHPKTK